MARRRGGNQKPFARTDRVNELLREIVAEELDRIDDDELGWVSISAVETTRELDRAMVYFSSLEDRGPEGDEEIVEVLQRHRHRLQRAVGSQSRLRRTPELVFKPDAGIRSGERIEEILRDIGPIAADEPEAPIGGGEEPDADAAAVGEGTDEGHGEEA